MKRGFIIITLVLLSLLELGAVELELYFTGKTFGSVEPCACPINPDGGISRRVKFLGDVKDSGSIFVDTGGMLAGGYGEWFGTPEGEERNNILKDAYRRIEYDAVVPGVSEFQYSADYLRDIISALGYNFLMANYNGELDLFKDFRYKKIGDQRILIIGVSLPDFSSISPSSDFRSSDIGDPVKAVKRVIKERRKKDDLVMIISFSDGDTAEALSKLNYVDVVLYGMNGVLLKEPRNAGTAIVAQSYFNTKKIGLLSLQSTHGNVKKWDFEYFRLSPSVGEVADLFDSVMTLQPGNDLYHLYLVFDEFLPRKGEKDIIKILLKNHIGYKALFKSPDEKGLQDFWILNNKPEDFLSGKETPVPTSLSRLKRSAGKELKNMGDGDHRPGIYTGLRYFTWESYELSEILWDLKVLGLIK